MHNQMKLFYVYMAIINFTVAHFRHRSGGFIVKPFVVSVALDVDALEQRDLA